MKYCIHCGKEMNESAGFCPYCGKEQSKKKNGEIDNKGEILEQLDENIFKNASGSKLGKYKKYFKFVVPLFVLCVVIVVGVRRHIVGGANRTLFSVNLPSRLCRP